jgi:hypothetical protein
MRSQISWIGVSFSTGYASKYVLTLAESVERMCQMHGAILISVRVILLFK